MLPRYDNQCPFFVCQEEAKHTSAKFFQIWPNLWISPEGHPHCPLRPCLEKLGTHHSPSDVLTKFVQAAVLVQHLPKLKLFKDPALSQVFKYGLGVEKIKTVKSKKDEFNDKQETNLGANHVLSRVYQQACSQHHGQCFVQGQVCMLNSGMLQFESGEHSRHLRVEGAFCQTQEIQMTQAFNSDHLFIQRLGQHASENQPISATRRWSFMQLMVISTDRQDDDQQVKQVAVILVNVIQAKFYSSFRMCTPVKGEDRRYKEGISHIIVSDDNQ